MKCSTALALLLGIIINACASTHEVGTPSNGYKMDEFSASTLVGYWKHSSDGLEVHITGITSFSTGSGSFKDFFGRLIHAGKFRNIRYLGDNRWECQQYRHQPNLVYPEDENTIFWEDALIEMIDMNTIQVGDDVYYRM